LGQSCGRREKEWGPRRQQQNTITSSALSSIPQPVIQRPGRVFDHWNLSPRDKLCLQNAFLDLSTCQWGTWLDRNSPWKVTTNDGFAQAFGLFGNEKWSNGVKLGVLALGYGLGRNRAIFDPELSLEYLSACRRYTSRAISTNGYPARDLLYLALFMAGAALLNNDVAEAKVHSVGLLHSLVRTAMFSFHLDIGDGHSLGKDLDRILDESIPLLMPKATTQDQLPDLLFDDSPQPDDLPSISDLEFRYETTVDIPDIPDRFVFQQLALYRNSYLQGTETRSSNFTVEAILTAFHCHKALIIILDSIVYPTNLSWFCL
jgi:hypothetical protein